MGPIATHAGAQSGSNTIQSENRRDRLKDFAQGVFYLAATITAIGLVVLSYKTEVCGRPRFGALGLTMNCTTPQSSIAINFITPLFALTAFVMGRHFFARALQH